VPDTAVLQAPRPGVPESRVPDPRAVHVREHGLSRCGTQRPQGTEQRQHVGVELDAPPCSAGLRLTDALVVVRAADVGDAGAQVDIVPAECGDCARVRLRSAEGRARAATGYPSKRLAACAKCSCAAAVVRIGGVNESKVVLGRRCRGCVAGGGTGNSSGVKATDRTVPWRSRSVSRSRSSATGGASMGRALRRSPHRPDSGTASTDSTRRRAS
jgi:hypothetical protein